MHTHTHTRTHIHARTHQVHGFLPFFYCKSYRLVMPQYDIFCIVISQHCKNMSQYNYHDVINTLKYVMHYLLNINYFCQNIMYVFIRLSFFSDTSTWCRKVSSKICGNKLTIHYLKIRLNYIHIAINIQ